MTTTKAQVSPSRINPITQEPTSCVIFGYLDATTGIINDLDQHGRPDENRVIGKHIPGAGQTLSPIGKIEGEAVMIKDQRLPIHAGMFNKHGKRTHGVVLIDATTFKTGQ